ncbi:MAG: PEP-CTERM sorting domain-containing protein [Thermoguttaceae bacterium]|nr:PEP-CTERM sorting domain-containing protein [Thermoguttaceae bacterium]
MNSRFFHILPAALIALGCALGTASVNAEIIGFDDFDGGKYGWNYNPSTGARAETSAEWTGTVKIENGKLVTQGDTPMICFHPTEQNDAAFQNKGMVIASVEYTVLGDTSKWSGLSYYDFGSERHFLGMPGGSNGHFGIASGQISSTPVVQGQTYQLIALNDYVSGKKAVWAFEEGTTPTIWDVRSPLAEVATTTNWTTRIRLASGADTKTTWDNLTAATAFSDVFDYSPIKGFTEYYPFISESFSNYTEGKTSGQLMNGQIPYGYRPLTAFSGNAEIVSGGLEYDGWNQNSGMLKVAGNTAQIKFDYGVFEELGLSAENSNLIGGEGVDGTLYYGWLMQDSDSQWIGGPELFLGSREVLGIGSVNQSNQLSLFCYDQNGKQSTLTLKDGADTLDENTHLFIAKIEFNADGLDDLTVFVDPDLSLSEAEQSDSVVSTMQGDFTFDGLTWRNGRTTFYDEFRMGLSWGSLMNHQVPEPSTFALLLGGVFTLGFLRRRAVKKAEKSI